ncbi:hypothetical protein B0T19DRAFT_126620 [Cercophora scortea]|uniref:Uncharacterized protein n=1 Tax=Cercophora scortea TaxID=314031 RepID=A0AAE0IY95_9PEZI|nr:hypothetical protein B0T19DRAFT_126620 [Cercophora scortea]
MYKISKPRTLRSQQKKTANAALAYFVSNLGGSCSIPYSNYFRRRSTYLFADGSKRCSECIERKVSCDSNDFASSLIRSVDEVKSIEEEEEALLNRLLTLRKRKRAARSRAEGLFQRGSQQVEEERSAQAAAPSPSFSWLDPSLADLPQTPAVPADPGSAGKTVEISQGNSANI